MYDFCTRRQFLRQAAAAGTASLFTNSMCSAYGKLSSNSDSENLSESKPNILFIAVDDLRTQLGCYGHTQTISPNIDRVASEGIVFERAYCQMPACGPSRASLMSGIYPFGNRFKSWRADRGAPNAIKLGGHFKAHGYHTVCNGKIYHTNSDSADSWSEEPWRVYDYNTHGKGDWGAVHFDKIWLDSESKNHRSDAGRGPYREAADVPDDAYEDGKVAEKSIQDLHRLSKKDKPFFLACGFHRPHLPFNAPEKYYDMYDPSEINLADNRFTITNKPKELRNSNEITRYSQIEGWPDDENFHREARHSYYACVTYIDTLIGKLMAELKALELEKDTIVVIWGDHGWLLGEHNFWGKHNTLNETLRVPLIIRAPGFEHSRTDALVELVDLYPTLCELADLPKPNSHSLDGKSFVPLLENPDLPWKKAVFSEWGTGKAVKTDRYLYTEWNTGSKMLFDHRTDPYENVNVAGKPENAEIVKELSELLKTVRKKR